MKVESIAECKHSEILLTCITRLLVLKKILGSFLEWLLKTGFTVLLVPLIPQKLVQPAYMNIAVNQVEIKGSLV